MTISWKVILLIIGVSSLTIRTLLDSSFGQGTLLYILVPFVISLALAFFTRSSEERSVGWRYMNHMRIATIVLLATSVVLFEGFICVLMFMPIYYLFASLAFFIFWLSGGGKDDDDHPENTFRMVALPSLVLLLATEGLTPATTVERTGYATIIAESPLSVAQLQSNMAKPITFETDRHWFMQLFPLPDSVEAGSLAAGDTHKLHFTYKRWFFTNSHKGEMHVQIANVSPTHVRTNITRNDSYLANYMTIGGTDVIFKPLASGGTRVKMTVRYERMLDPAWYFGPMQQFAAKESGRQFLRDIIMRHPILEIDDGQNHGA